MATEKELRTQQMSTLYDLLKLQQDHPEIARNKGLLDLIKKAKAVMDKEDVAWVEKILAE